MSKNNEILAVFVFFILVTGGLVVGVSLNFAGTDDEPNGIEQFNSTEEFENYTTQQPTYNNFVRPTLEATARADSASSGGDTSVRQTNVQVLGIDEPDNVKLTDGAAYYSPERQYYFIPQPTLRIAEPIQPQEDRSTKVISTNNTENPEIADEIEQHGKMLREGSNLVIYNQDRIVGYDISDSRDPVEDWSKELPSQTSVVTARMTDGTVFLVLDTRNSNCPVKPIGNETISCDDIYYPTELNQGNGVYSALSIDGGSGELQSETSFVGSGQSTVYMSKDNMYIAYTQSNMMFKQFIEEGIENINIDSDVKQQIEDIDTEDINSQYGLRSELQDVLAEESRDFKRNGDVTRIMEEYQSFLGENQREAQRTIITKLDIEDSNKVEPNVAGSIPGKPLNQYSFDERNGNLRVATTIQGYGDSQSLNDMYVLNEALNIQGSVKDMAEGQRVYAVRFIGDKGYIITFRQIDPLHVINIENPENPQEVGVLELPGFSDYLHQVSEDEIMGIGESQDRRAKIVLFDVSNESQPVVSDSLIFKEEYSTEISEDYRAFLEDEEMGVYYIPAGEGVRVIEAENGELTQKKLISTPTGAERVRIIGDDLYVFHEDGVISVDRQTYEVNDKLSFN